MDFFADVWLNGEYLGAHEGMFNTFEFDVTDRVDLVGVNVVVGMDGSPRDGTEYVQVDFSENPLGEAIHPRGGCITVPQGPGLGVDPDPRLLDKLRTG